MLEATAALLLEFGLHGTHTRAVTERAGVGTRLLNHYFRWPELRAAAWLTLFESVARDMRSDGESPEDSFERHLAETFSAAARPIWRLWVEAKNLAPGDPSLASALAGARDMLRTALTDLVGAGCVSGAWHLSAPKETALRLEALRDGLVGMILSADPEVDDGAAERHLRRLFQLECRAR